MTDSDSGRAVCSRKGFGKDAVTKKKVTLKRDPSISNVADLGTRHFTKERFEALCKMVDMEAISGRNGVSLFGPITCDKNGARELAQADFSLMGVSTRAMVFGSRWMYKTPCRRRLRLRATGTSLCEVLRVTEKLTGCETPLVVCVIPEPLREQCARVAADNHPPGQLRLQVKSCEQVWENPDITTRVLESR